jgi:hypothetical protein
MQKKITDKYRVMFPQNKEMERKTENVTVPYMYISYMEQKFTFSQNKEIYI